MFHKNVKTFGPKALGCHIALSFLLLSISYNCLIMQMIENQAVKRSYSLRVQNYLLSFSFHQKPKKISGQIEGVLLSIISSMLW